MKFENYRLSLQPSQFLGMRSLIRYCLEPIGFADTLCSAVLMLFNMSSLPLTVSFTSFPVATVAEMLLDLLW